MYMCIVNMRSAEKYILIDYSEHIYTSQWRMVYVSSFTADDIELEMMVFLRHIRSCVYGYNVLFRRKI